jgi:hypothetical protein
VNEYNQNSIDATLSRILQRLDSQDSMLVRIDAGVSKTNGRVDSLEREKWIQRGFVAACAALGATAVEWVKAHWNMQ